MDANLLHRETSPYLLQHKDNPVHWRAWGSDTLALAQRQNRPILLSIGYAACHWCHVMAHESFEDPAIARQMNDGFINVKVDREERPDLDAIYQMALAMTNQQGGWPLTMFLTPTGDPFWGGTYFPPTARFGLPSFSDVLRGVADRFHANPTAIAENVSILREGLATLSKPPMGDGLSMDLLDRTAEFAARLVDPIHGGLSGAPKFPQVPLYRFLRRAHLRDGNPYLGRAVDVTLDHMCQGGLYDHLGGGFARYSTDEVWLAPHFEKMLYDNALLLELLSERWLDTANPLYVVRARETVQWLLRDMTVHHEDGLFAFASAFDADSEGVEGKYYVWTEAEIDLALGPDAQLFKKIYDVTTRGNWEHHTILNRPDPPLLFDHESEAVLARCRETLLQIRAGRVPPLRDDKALCDWNGLAIAALAGAGTALNEPQWIEAGETVFSFVRSHMTENGRLGHSWRQGRLRHPPTVEDYANMIRAALALYQATGTPEYLDQAETWVDHANSLFRDHADGGYFLGAVDTDDVILRTKPATDNPTPAGNGTMAEVLARLFHLTGKPAYREAAEAVIALFSRPQPEYLLNLPTLLGAFDLLASAVHIVISGPPADAATGALLRAAFAAPLANRIVTRLPPGVSLPPGHPAHGKEPRDGIPTAFVCRGPVCGLPITDADDLNHALSAV
jgi:uncharacterized protein